MLIGLTGRIAIERERTGCAETLANLSNLLGFLDAFKAKYKGFRDATFSSFKVRNGTAVRH
jgi:hypothetical protein